MFTTQSVERRKRSMKSMELPVINFADLEGEKRSQTMAQLHHACERWGFFQIENHGIDATLMDKVKQFANTYYEGKLKDEFYKSDITKTLDSKNTASNLDWESSFFIRHHPNSNINEFEGFPEDFCKTMNDYAEQLIKVAEKLAELMSENLGLEKNFIKDSFSGSTGPAVGTKVAKYPECPQPELVRGLREHYDAGGIILVLQDDKVPGLEFYKDAQWVKIPPTINNRLFVNTGDQIEVLSNGKYKSIVHRVMAVDKGSRLSIAAFYNPASDAVISPAPKLLYPNGYRFQDYMQVYAKTKFSDKGPRFESLKAKEMANGKFDLPA